jgi:hypothetical protein
MLMQLPLPPLPPRRRKHPRLQLPRQIISLLKSMLPLPLPRRKLLLQ